jgi:hypothetical protein
MIPGHVARMLASPTRPVPHMGWNQLEPLRADPLLEGIEAGAHVYFVHSYAAPVTADTIATSDYGGRFCAAVHRGQLPRRAVPSRTLSRPAPACSPISSPRGVMLLIPSIDLRGGHCVRLLKGEFDAETRYDIEPGELLGRYADAGVRWLHLVDLDGARDGTLGQPRTAPPHGQPVAPCMQLGGGCARCARSTRRCRGVAAR